MISQEISRILLMISTTLVCSFVIMFLIRKISIHVGAVDADVGEKRRIHKFPTPKLGGIGIFFSFLLGYMIFATPDKQMLSILIGSLVILFIGMIDDIKPFKSNRIKLYAEIIAALIVIFYGGLLLDNVEAFGLQLQFGWFAYPLTIFWLVGMMNAINMIDGMDGLSSGISSIFFATVGIIALMSGGSGTLEITLTFVMLGATLGFLAHNFHPAKIFLGDSGAMFIGFIIGIIALLGFKNVTITSLVVPILIMAVPILDTFFALLRRAIKKEPLNRPDRKHIHFQLLDLGLSYKATVLTIYAIDGLFALASIIYVLENPGLGKLIYIILLVLVLLAITKTTIVLEHNKRNKKRGG